MTKLFTLYTLDKGAEFMLKKTAGIIQIIPLLLVAFLAVSVLAITFNHKPKGTGETKAVLSESESSGGGHGGDSSGSTGSTSSSGGSNTSGTVKAESQSTPKPERTAEAVENEHALETPEPVETPEAEIENETEVEVKEGTESSKVKIGQINGMFTFREQKFGAESQFPVSVNKTTKELTITTPNGAKVVAVLPDAAVENMLGQNVIDRILGANGQLVQVKVDANGNLFYEISGVKDEKLLGLFSVAIPKTLSVSTQTGDLTSINQDTLSKLLDALSF